MLLNKQKNINVNQYAAGPNRVLPSSSVFCLNFCLLHFTGSVLGVPDCFFWLPWESLSDMLFFLHACVLFFRCLFFGPEARVRSCLPGDTDLVQDESKSDGYNRTDTGSQTVSLELTVLTEKQKKTN